MPDAGYNCLDDADEQALERLYCPTCREALIVADLGDPFVRGLRCCNGHRFQVTLKDGYGWDVPENMLDGLDESKMLRQWVREEALRRCINTQIATMLRRIYEIGELGMHVECADDREVFAFCPICRKALGTGEAWDSWCAGLKCESGHRYDYRNGIHFIDTGIRLEEDMPDDRVVWLCAAYLRERKASVRPHRTILKAFRHFLDHRPQHRS